MIGDAIICADVAAVDIDRARTFYEGALGLTPFRIDGDRGVYYRAGGGTMLNLYERDHVPAAQTAATFLVDDITAAMSGLRANGVVFEDYDKPDLKTLEGVFADGKGFKVSWFKDPDGNILSLEQLAEQ